MQVQIRDGICRIVELRVGKVAADVLTHICPPGINVRNIQSVKIAKYATGSIYKIQIVIDRQAGRIRGGPIDLDRIIRTGRSAVRAGIIEYVVSETSGIYCLSAVESIRSSCPARRRTSDINAVV